MMTKRLRFSIKTVSEANQWEHWSQRVKRKKSQQRDFAMLWRSFKPKVTLPATITFTRYSCKTLDSDNCSGAFKHIRDQLAREIGVDDGSPLIEWRYRQERITTRDHYFDVEIEV